MNTANIPNIGSYKVSQEADKLNRVITKKLAFDRSFKNIEAQKVFELMGLKKAEFSQFPKDIKEKIISAIKSTSGFKYAIPSSKVLREEAPWPDQFQLVTNEDYSTIYFFTDSHTESAYGKISWTKLRDWGNGYEVRPMNHDSNTSELVSTLALYEAQVRLASEIETE